MPDAEILHPRDLAAGDAEAWRAMCAADERFSSPLLGPDFAAAVGEVRVDAAVAVFRDRGRPVGFLPHHRRPGGVARPIGAPFSDQQALVTAGPLSRSGSELLAAAGLAGMRFTGLNDPHRMFDAAGMAAAASHLISLDGDAETHLESIRCANPKKFKNYRRLEHKLERDIGPLTLCGQDASADAFRLIMAWKRDQLSRTGLHDVYAPAWSATLMERLFRRREGPVQGLLITLRAGDRLVAGHFGVRSGQAFHPWVAAADPTLAAYSPGHVFLRHVIAAMPSLGLASYDLSAGHDHYKAQYASRQVLLARGPAFAPTLAGRYAASKAMAWRAGGGVHPMAARLARRLDQIASVELSLAGRARGLAGAVSAIRRRVAPSLGAVGLYELAVIMP